MPYVIEVNTEANKKYYEVSRELGLPADTIEEGKSSLLSFVRILNTRYTCISCGKAWCFNMVKYFFFPFEGDCYFQAYIPLFQ